MKTIARSMLMLITLFIVGSAFTPLLQAQPRRRYHHRYYRHHRPYRHHYRR